jgi:hypothetical protein
MEQLETLHQAQSMIRFYLEQTEGEARKEWEQKLTANQKEIDSALKKCHAI